MFTLEDIECIIEQAEPVIYDRALDVVKESCYSTDAKLSVNDVIDWQLLYTVRRLLSRKISDSTYQCLVNKLRK